MGMSAGFGVEGRGSAVVGQVHFCFFYQINCHVLNVLIFLLPVKPSS